MVAFDISMVPQTVIDAWWALIIAVVFAATAYIQKLGKDEAVETTKAVIDYFDPTVKTSTTPGSHSRTDLSDERRDQTVSHIRRGSADQVSILEQVAKARRERPGVLSYHDQSGLV